MLLTKDDLKIKFNNGTLTDSDIEDNPSIIRELIMDKNKQKDDIYRPQIKEDNGTKISYYNGKGELLKNINEGNNELINILRKAMIDGESLPVFEHLAEKGVPPNIAICFYTFAQDSFQLHQEQFIKGLIISKLKDSSLASMATEECGHA